MPEILRVEHISKGFPGVQAVDDVCFSLDEGQVMALVGENGAGKSTLTKIICGALRPDVGRILVGSDEKSFNSAYDAMRAGISMVYQELTMVGDMNVAENIFMNRQPRGRSGLIDSRKLCSETRALLAKIKLDIDPRALVKTLSVGTQQLLELLKALSTGAKVIVLDEPTSSLDKSETTTLFDNILQLRGEGYSFIYISHKMSEIFTLADKVMVMRDGRCIGTKPIGQIDERGVVSLMVGREIKDFYGAEHTQRKISESFYFEIEGLSAHGLYEDVSFGVRRGEIVGFAGLIGSGRTEMALGIFGAHKRDFGTIKIDGRAVTIRNPRDALRQRIAYLTEDRKRYGLSLDFSLEANLIAANLRKYARWGFMNNRNIESKAREEVRKFSISTTSIRQKVGNLSGGNQQKCLLAKGMGINPEVIILDEPTRGVDVGAKVEIYEMIKQFADQGRCVVVISSELPELLGICDRIYVMHEGSIRGEVAKKDFSEKSIMEYATGFKNA